MSMPDHSALSSMDQAIPTRFPRECRVLDFGVASREQAGEGRQLPLLWPAWAHHVVRATPQRTSLNLLQRAVLGLCHSRRLASNQIADRLQLEPDLVVRIMDELQAAGAVGRNGQPTARGLDALLVRQRLLGCVLQDPWSGRLWPYLVAPPDQPQLRTPGALRASAVSARLDGIQVVPDTTAIVARPAPTDLHRTLEQYRRHVDAHAEGQALPGSMFKHVALLDAPPVPVFLATLLHVLPHASDWHVADPFGRGSSQALTQRLEQLLPAADELRGLARLLRPPQAPLPAPARPAPERVVAPVALDSGPRHQDDLVPSAALAQSDSAAIEADMAALERRTADVLALVESQQQRAREVERAQAGLERDRRRLDEREQLLRRQAEEVEARLAEGVRQLGEDIDAVVAFFNGMLREITAERDHHQTELDQRQARLMDEVAEARAQAMAAIETAEIDLARRTQIVSDQEGILEQKSAALLIASRNLEARRAAVEARARQLEQSHARLLDELKVLRLECDALQEKLLAAPSQDMAERLRALEAEWQALGEERLRIKSENRMLRGMLDNYRNITAELQHVLGDLS